LKYINKKNNTELIIIPELLEKIKDTGKEHYPNEFGGFLFGYYSDCFHKLHLEKVLLPKKYSGFPCLFERSINGIENLFNEIYFEQGLYYVGEWHTHPNGSSTYSNMDLQSMINIERCETVHIKNPILLILSVLEQKIRNYTFYLYSDGGLIEYEQN
jgi:[CysO sulfur-carrier protein]-S-L-cysteine hydrolase